MSNTNYDKVKDFASKQPAEVLKHAINSVLTHCADRPLLTGSDYDEGYTEGSSDTKDVIASRIKQSIGYTENEAESLPSSKEEGVNEQTESSSAQKNDEIEVMTEEAAREKFKHYPRLYHWSDDDQKYIGSIPDLCGYCCDGATVEEVVKKLEEVIELYVTDYSDGDFHEFPEIKSTDTKYVFRTEES